MKYLIKNLQNVLFKKYLLTTNIVSSGILMQIGDLLSQNIEKKSSTAAAAAAESSAENETKTKVGYDWERNAKMFIVGAIAGPLHHYFYGWLDNKYSGATVKITTIKILYDQFIMSPVCIVGFFYPAGWLFGQSTAECTQELRSKFLKVYITDWMVWPATQFINFYYLRPQYRVIYVNIVTMMYNVFLSHIKHGDAPHLQTIPPAKRDQ